MVPMAIQVAGDVGGWRLRASLEVEPAYQDPCVVVQGEEVAEEDEIGCHPYEVLAEVDEDGEVEHRVGGKVT